MKIDEYESFKTAIENLRLKKHGKVSKSTIKFYKYVEIGEKLDGFRILMHYLLKSRDHIAEDLKLINAALERVES